MRTKQQKIHKHISSFQIIILLIQIGGMCVVTVAIAIATALGRKIGLMQRSTMQKSISARHVGDIVRMTKFIFRMTLIFETIRCRLLSPVFAGNSAF